VIAFLVARDLLDEGRIELLDSWKSGHTGFSAHNAVTLRAEDHDGLERLSRIPAPRLHLVRYYGHYAHVPRARRRQDASDRAAHRRVYDELRNDGGD
jgi:hypothetical protein